MRYSERRYTGPDGSLSLYARDYGGDGPPLLMMHGLTRNSGDFDGLAAHLAGNYRLIVPDQRGRGRSDYDPDPSRYRPDVYAADMFALLEELGVERPGVVGTSMGGLIALVMNAMRPGIFPAVVFNDIGPVLSPEGLARIGGYVGGGKPMADWDEAASACAAINRDAFPDFAEADWRDWARRTCRELPDGRVEYAYDPAIAAGFEDTAAPQPDLWPLWEALGDTAVLVVRGALSDLLSARTVETMGQRHRGPFAKVTVPGRGHAPLLDEPAALGAIRPFLQTHLPG